MIPEKSAYTKLPSPVAVPLASVNIKSQTTYFAAGIVNPFGPTLGILTSDGTPSEGARCRLLWFSLNPFSQDCTHVGDVMYGESWAPEIDLQPFEETPLGAAPTLLISGSMLDEDESKRIFARVLMRFEDGGNTLAKLRQFPGDPWKRIEDETDKTSGLFSTLLKRSGSKPANSPLSEADALAFAEMQLDPLNARKELQAFMVAWKGAIEFSGNKLSLSLDDFTRKYFACFAVTTRLPPSIK